MTDELLRKAAEALREESDSAEDGARFTRARVMASVHKSELRRRTRVAFALPIAACFAAATAWGTVNGKTQAFIADVGEALGFTPKAVAPPAPKPKAVVRRPPPPTANAPSPVPTTEEPATNEPTATLEPSEPATESAAPNTPNTPNLRRPVADGASAGRDAANTRPSTTPSAETPVPKATDTAPGSAAAKPDISDRAHELYRDAHRRHFVEHDYAAALTAWNTYLSEAPGGRFALEARYNRALCLVRLGRNAEARSALTPFAAGDFGGYRQREASSLMDALR